jgi:hypothetical protein
MRTDSPAAAEPQLGGVGDDVVTGPGLDVRHGHHGRVEDVDAAGDHRLQREHDLGGDGDRVGAGVTLSWGCAADVVALTG